MALEILENGGGRHDDAGGRGEPADYPSAICGPVQRHGTFVNRLPPGEHVRMCDDNYGAVDAKPGMRISVYVDHIDFVPFDQVHEPVAALRKINYSVRHPLEAIVALDEDNIFEFADGVALSLTRPRPHRRQHEPGLGHRSA